MVKKFLAIVFALAGGPVAAADGVDPDVAVAMAMRARASGPAARKPYDYRETLRRVSAGERLTLAVGVPDAADGSVPALSGFAPGVYQCYPSGGRALMVPLSPPPVVTQAGTPVPKAEGPAPGPAVTRVTVARGAGRPLPPEPGRGSFAGSPRTGSTITSARWTGQGGVTEFGCPESG